MKSKKVIHAWGRYFAQLHQISRKFSVDHPIIAKRIQTWREIHHGVLKDIVLDKEDEEVVGNVDHWGVLHGDLNCSNFFYHREGDYLSVFDSDQTQQGFFLWDVAQACLSSVMLKEAGLPISGTPVP